MTHNQPDAMEPESFWKFASKEVQTSTLCRHISAEIQRAIAAYGYASMVVPGGSTPKPLLEALGKEPIQWNKLWLTLSDERWVPLDSDERNEKMLRSILPVDSMRFVSLCSRHSTPEEGEATVEAALGNMPRPFDIVLLGMGNDGHFASLFPDTPELEEGLKLDNPKLCQAIAPAGGRTARISLTLAALKRSRKRFLLVQGEEKWNVIKQAEKPETSPLDLPVKALLEAAPTTICWCP